MLQGGSAKIFYLLYVHKFNSNLHAHIESLFERKTKQLLKLEKDLKELNKVQKTF